MIAVKDSHLRTETSGIILAMNAPHAKPKPSQLRLKIALALLLVAGTPIAYLWFSKYKGTGWTNMINPVLWYHRNRGDDLYQREEAFLRHGNRDLPEVALTFDDGPHPQSRTRLLDTLKRHGVNATFFDVGQNMAAHPELVKRTLEDGDEIANHSMHHFRFTEVDSQERHREMNEPDVVCYALTGKHFSLIRPPGMQYNPQVLKETRELGYIVVGYTTASQDFDPKESPDVVAERTLRRTENGSIILLHDYPPTADALDKILDTLKSRGFKCVTITEMLNHLPTTVHDAAKEFREQAEK